MGWILHLPSLWGIRLHKISLSSQTIQSPICVPHEVGNLICLVGIIARSIFPEDRQTDRCIPQIVRYQSGLGRSLSNLNSPIANPCGLPDSESNLQGALCWYSDCLFFPSGQFCENHCGRSDWISRNYRGAISKLLMKNRSRPVSWVRTHSYLLMVWTNHFNSWTLSPVLRAGEYLRKSEMPMYSLPRTTFQGMRYCKTFSFSKSLVAILFSSFVRL